MDRRPPRRAGATRTGTKCSGVGKAIRTPWALVAGNRARRPHPCARARPRPRIESDAHAGVCESGLKSIARRLCVRNPLPTISTPSSRNGASLRPSANSSVGSMLGNGQLQCRDVGLVDRYSTSGRRRRDRARGPARPRPARPVRGSCGSATRARERPAPGIAARSSASETSEMIHQRKISVAPRVTAVLPSGPTASTRPWAAALRESTRELRHPVRIVQYGGAPCATKIRL